MEAWRVEGDLRPAPDEELRRVLDSGPPLERDEWSLGDAALAEVLAEVARGPTRIVECGSGPSTVAIARLLAVRGHGRVCSLEHDPDWASRTRDLLRAEGLEAHASVIEAPLVPGPPAQPGCTWYDRDALAGLPESGVDLLIVDGPPAGEPGLGRARYPALPALAARLAPGATVILDDIGREGERWVARRWRREHGIALEPRAGGLAVGAMPGPGGGRRFSAVARIRGRLAARRAARLRERLGIAALETQVADLWRHTATVEAGVSNHELRIRRLAELDAFRSWIDAAALGSEPLISVITPAHRRTGPLARAIRSVLEQRYARWEHVVVVDGGDPSVVAVVEAAGDDRVRCLPIPQSGPGQARNHGLEAARGELIAYLDDDNHMHPLWLKAVAWAFGQRPEVDVAYGGWIIDDPLRLHGDRGGALPEYWITPFDRALQERQALADMSAIAHRAGLAEAVFDPSLRGLHDWDLLRRLTAERDPLVIPAVAAHYSTEDADRLSAVIGPEDAEREVLSRATTPGAEATARG